LFDSCIAFSRLEKDRHSTYFRGLLHFVARRQLVAPLHQHAL